jgi:methyl-accepting chemotaxis protein
MKISNPSKSAHWVKIAFLPKLVKRSVTTSLIVGMLLNIINQGEAIWGDQSLILSSFLLTFLVPYFVSTVSGTLSALEHQKNSEC